MTVAGVISDTHGVLRPEVLARLRGCDCIIHAGDFADFEILDQLADTAPLYAVRGNNDWSLVKRLQPTLRFQLEDLRFFMVHDRTDVPHGLTGVDVVIFGHTHRYYQKVEKGVLWLNPGSCGRRRFSSSLSFAIMRISGKSYDVEKVEFF